MSQAGARVDRSGHYGPSMDGYNDGKTIQPSQTTRQSTQGGQTLDPLRSQKTYEDLEKLRKARAPSVIIEGDFVFPRFRYWPSRPALGERWPSRLVATATEERLNPLIDVIA